MGKIQKNKNVFGRRKREIRAGAKAQVKILNEKRMVFYKLVPKILCTPKYFSPAS